MNLIQFRFIVRTVSKGSWEVALFQINLPDVSLLVFHAVLVHRVLREDVYL